VYDLETSGIGAPYIYDISHLRVNAQVAVVVKTNALIVLFL
jgi:hypothetical protein